MWRRWRGCYEAVDETVGREDRKVQVKLPQSYFASLSRHFLMITVADLRNLQICPSFRTADVQRKLNFMLNYCIMHPVARVSIYIYRNLRTQQMSVLVLLCTSYTTCFGPYLWPSSGGFVTQKN
jgi:hypothetical protein